MEFGIHQYKALLKLASQRFKFVPLTQFNISGKVALWRHDIDFSPHRAYALAAIEADLGLRTTYFVQLSSSYYNLFEPNILHLIKQILSFGHDIGLHFSPDVLPEQNLHSLESRLVVEANILRDLLETNISLFTFHNPSTFTISGINKLCLSNLINASSTEFSSSYTYCSDSNGIWRFRSLYEVCLDPAVTRLYALTHPVWWQETTMSPRKRIQRCIDSRASFCSNSYDNLLALHSAPNIR